MALTKWRPLGGLTKFFDEDFPLTSWRPFKERFFEVGWDLAVDVYEKNGNVIAEMNLPGIDPDTIDVLVEEDYLTVKGSREEKKETEEKDYYSKEIKRGSFERTVKLPTVVNKEGTEAEYKDGVLKIILPKEESESSEKIKIKVKK